MKIQYFPYDLKFRNGRGARQGSLFRFEQDDGGVFFGDLLPWPEYGDLELEKEISEIKSGRFSDLFLKIIEMAKRSTLTNTHTQLSKLKNHFIVSDISNTSLSDISLKIAQGHSVFKIKAGRNINQEIVWLNQLAPLALQLRLDFNSKLNLEQFKFYFSSLNTAVKEKIDFVEDPMPFDQESWTAGSLIVPLAIDFEYDNWEKNKNGAVPFRVIVLKPARQNFQEIISKTYDLKVDYLVTSSMDAILGELQTQSLLPALSEMLGSRLLICGCETRHLFEDHALFHVENLQDLQWLSI